MSLFNAYARHGYLQKDGTTETGSVSKSSQAISSRRKQTNPHTSSKRRLSTDKESQTQCSFGPNPTQFNALDSRREIEVPSVRPVTGYIIGEMMSKQVESQR